MMHRTGKALLLACLAAALTACAGTGTVSGEKDFLVVEGRSQIEPMTFADQATWSLAFSGPIEANAEAPLDPSVGDGGERVLMAQAQARRASLRALAQRIMALPDAQNQPVARTVAANAQLGTDLDALLREKAKVAVTMRDRNARAVAGIDGTAVMTLLRDRGAAMQVRLSDLPADAQQKLKGEAYEGAVKDLRSRLRSRVMETPDANGQPMGPVFQGNSDAMSALEQKMMLVQADTVRYLEDGTCIIEVYFDANEARAIARDAGGWRLFGR